MSFLYFFYLFARTLLHAYITITNKTGDKQKQTEKVKSTLLSEGAERGEDKNRRLASFFTSPSVTLKCSPGMNGESHSASVPVV